MKRIIPIVLGLCLLPSAAALAADHPIDAGSVTVAGTFDVTWDEGGDDTGVTFGISAGLAGFLFGK